MKLHNRIFRDTIGSLSRRRTAATRGWAIVLLLIVATSVIPKSSPAVAALQTSPVLTIEGPDRVALGEKITLTLTLVHSREVAAYESVLLFDPSATTFSSLDQDNNDLSKLGRDVGSLAVVEVPYGAAIGFYSCAVPDCVSRQGKMQAGGGNGVVALSTVELATRQPGTIEIALGGTLVVDVAGNAVPVTVETPSIRVEVESASPDYPAPSRPWDVPVSGSASRDRVDLSGDGLATNADAMEVALAWEALREEGRACGDLPEPHLDLNGNGCIDVADLQFVASNYSASDAPRKGNASESPAAQQAVTTFVVNNAGDQPDANPGNGQCATGSGTCTLRAAIMEANNLAGPNVINFNIAGGGVMTIQLTKKLPTLLDESGGTTINGYTQPGASPNTHAQSSNAVIRIQIRGGGEGNFEGLAITSSGNVVRGLSFFRLNHAIVLHGNGADNNVIAGNFVGTNADGSYRSPVMATTANGIFLKQGPSGNQIGGANRSDRNVISGNESNGVSLIWGGTNGNRIIGNIVGLRPNGSSCLGNRIHGIDINFGASNNVVGGTGQGERNVSTGNGTAGVDVSHGSNTTGNSIVGNYIGTGINGKQAPSNCSNNRFGVRLEDGVGSTTISDNVIGGNAEAGVRILDNYTSTNVVANNRIGTALDGTPIPNTAGILNDGSRNTFGPNNVIANNSGIGVRLMNANGDRNTITRNSIYNNGGLGIDFNPVGVTPNDGGDGDGGPNQQLNFPVIQNATRTVVSGTVCANCTVEIFRTGGDPSGHGEGRNFLGSAVANSNGQFSVNISGIQTGQSVTATATDPNGNTSEFAKNKVVTGG